jgi:8-oxo-dGTP pyrophosphatase MutT (NUDIX family)
LWHRDFHDATIVECPEKTLIGKSFGQIADERGLHPLDAFLDVLVENGERNVRWTTIVANHRPKHLNALAIDPSVHMGFSDAGAHLRNLAFYNFALKLLRRVRDAELAGKPFMTVEHAVHRLTAEVADWFGLPAGTLRKGDRADFVVIVPWQDRRLTLVEQYRYPVRARIWEFPMGTWEQAPGTDPAVLAAAELREETGLAAGLPMSVIEAMLTGLPVVATDIRGPREQVEQEVTGLLVPPGESTPLAAALGRLAADPALRRRMGEAGRARALARYTEGRVVARTLDLLGL